MEVCHDDARMIALHITASAQAQALPEYPLSRLIEAGHVGMQHVPYEFRSGRVTVAGHQFSLAELIATLDKLREMAEAPAVQPDMFEEAA